MKTSLGLASLAAFSVLAGTLLMEPAVQTASAAGLEKETAIGDQLVRTLHIQEALGPLAPVALSPFFALTCLSGASLLAESGILPDAIAKNPLLGGGSVLHNGFVFTGLLALTLVTAAPKLMKVTKPFGQAIDQIEGHAGIIAVVAVQMLSQIQLGEPDVEKVAVVYQAGIFSFSLTTLVAVFSAINIFVVNTVKFFFEVLIFLSPIPAVDAVFEAMNKAVVAFLVSLYVLSPWAAMVVNLIIFGLCLIIFAWVFRRVTYLRSVLGDPIRGWLSEGLFRRPRATPTSTHLPGKIAAALPDSKLVLKAFAGRSMPGVKRKTRGWLVLSGDRLHFAVARCFRDPVIAALPSAGHVVDISNGFLSNTLEVTNDSGDVAARVIFTRRYNDILGAIRELVGSGGVGEEAARAGARSFAKTSRTAGKAVKSGDRDELRAELA